MAHLCPLYLLGEWNSWQEIFLFFSSSLFVSAFPIERIIIINISLKNLWFSFSFLWWLMILIICSYLLVIHSSSFWELSMSFVNILTYCFSVPCTLDRFWILIFYQRNGLQISSPVGCLLVLLMNCFTMHMVLRLLFSHFFLFANIISVHMF